MGDHRATISISFAMHGVTTRCDGMYLNWWEGAHDDMPSMVRDFFRDAESKSMSAFYEAQDKAEDKAHERRKALVASARSKLTDDELAALAEVAKDV